MNPRCLRTLVLKDYNDTYFEHIIPMTVKYMSVQTPSKDSSPDGVVC